MSAPHMCGDCEAQGRTGTGPHGETSGAEHCSCWYDGRAEGYREGREGAFRVAKDDCRASHTVETQRVNALQQQLDAAQANAEAVVDALSCDAHPVPDQTAVAEIVADLHSALHRAEWRIAAIRALWPHIEIPAGKHFMDKSTRDPGAPTCLRCKIEQALRG